jgi:hypothetical protein
LFIPYPGTDQQTALPGANVMLCAVYQVTASVTGSRLSASFAGSGNCAFAIYDNDDTGTAVATIQGTCPNPGIVADTTANFTLNAGALYRFCLCSDQATTKYLGLQAHEMSWLADAFTLAVGKSTTTCGAGATPPPTTGPLLNAATGNDYPRMPIVGVE